MRKRGLARRAEPFLVTRIDNHVTTDYQYRSLAYRPSAVGRTPASVPARHSCNNRNIAGVITAKSAARRCQQQTGPRARVSEAGSSPHHYQSANRLGTPPDRRNRIGILVCPVREYSPLPRPPSPAEPRTTRFMAANVTPVRRVHSTAAPLQIRQAAAVDSTGISHRPFRGRSFTAKGLWVLAGRAGVRRRRRGWR